MVSGLMAYRWEIRAMTTFQPCLPQAEDLRKKQFFPVTVFVKGITNGLKKIMPAENLFYLLFSIKR